MSTAWEAMRSGAPHLPYDPDLKARRDRCRRLLWRYNTQISPDDRTAQQALLTELLGALPDGIHITPPFHCDYGEGIRFGRNFYANSGCTILDGGAVTIGDNVLLAPNVALYTVNHPLHPALRNATWEHTAPITIGNNVWLGGNSVVLPGVSIGDNSVIGAGSVVVKSIPANSLAVGNPCRVLRQISDADRDQYAAWGIHVE